VELKAGAPRDGIFVCRMIDGRGFAASRSHYYRDRVLIEAAGISKKN
jgi:hypothetical protein